MMHKTPLVNHQLSVKLTPNEKELKARECASITSDIDKLDEEWKTKKKAYYDKRKPLAKRAIALAKEHMTGVEVRTVDSAVRVMDTESGKTWIEYDGMNYDAREMTAYEKACAAQKPLGLVETPVPATDEEPEPDGEDEAVDDLLGVIHEERTAKKKTDHTA